MFSDNPFFTIFNLKTIFIYFYKLVYATLCFYSQKKKKKKESFQK